MSLDLTPLDRLIEERKRILLDYQKHGLDGSANNEQGKIELLTTLREMAVALETCKEGSYQVSYDSFLVEEAKESFQSLLTRMKGDDT